MPDTMRLGSISGYLGQPGFDAPRPGLIVIHEWWGLDPQTCSIADRLSSLGYLTFAPDLFGGKLAPLGDSASASGLVKQYGPDGPSTLERAFDGLLKHPACTGQIGAVGFCFGGRMALELGLRRPLAGVCTFYGGGMQALFDQLHGLHSPVLGLYGDGDVSIPQDAIHEFDRILHEQRLEHEIVIYPEAGHAFFRDSDPSCFRPNAAKDAWSRLVSFLSRHMPIEPLVHPR
jgi:carboxymethylenebutenolidase